MLEVTDNSLAIVQEEPFGPVLTIRRFGDEAEAIALANDSHYGLSASVGVTEEGGFKLSGLGRRNGHAELDDFIEYKHIALKPGLARLSTGQRVATALP